jgi:hypothetical protein
MRPASSTVCPLATEIELFTMRWDKVGLSVFAVAVCPASALVRQI